MVVGSGYEDQPVDQIDFESLSDEELKKIAKEDERSTAQEAAEVELRKREAAADEGSGDGASISAGDKGISVTSMTSPDDPVARAEALGINSEGVNTDPDAGQMAVQEYFDKVEESGVIPPTGGPPSKALTLEAVVEREQQEKEARREQQREAWEAGSK